MKRSFWLGQAPSCRPARSPFLPPTNNAFDELPLVAVHGDDLTFKIMHGHYYVIDAKGDRAIITIPDVYQVNGEIQVINAGLLP